MRYYSIIAGYSVWNSVINGSNDPAALDIEFDITDQPNGTLSNGWLKIYGITPYVISQSVNYTGQRIQLFAGFTEGLPLANLQVPHQGLIMDGEIFPCWGNWIGNELSIEFTVISGPQSGLGGPTKPANLVHNMSAGQSLSTAIQNAVSSAFPGSNVNVNISPNLVLNYPDQGFYQGLQQYAAYVKALSHDILGTPSTTGYQGVTVSTIGNNINFGDGTVKGNVIPLQYYDLVGQPTWIGPQSIQIRTVLRADIVANGIDGTTQVTLPANTLVNFTADGAQNLILPNPLVDIQPSNVLNFQGTFSVNSVRHVGHFRQPTGESWITLINASANFPPPDVPLVNTSGQQIFTGSGGIGHA